MKGSVQERIITADNLNQDGLAVVLTATSFDIACILPDIDAQEAVQWKKGILGCSLLNDPKVPFFTILFNGMYLTAYFNFKKLRANEIYPWLIRKKKMVNLLLLEKNGLVLKAVHQVGMDRKLFAYLRKILSRQMFMNESNILRNAAALQSNMSPEEMFIAGKITWLKTGD